jgi:hypothetical protein
VGDTPVFVAVGDFRHNEILDLAVANVFSDNVSVLLGNGDGTFQRAVNYAAGLNAFSLAVGDFQGDGTRDLAVGNADSHDVSVLLGNGDGTFQTPVNYPVVGEPRSVVIGDFDGDGLPDLAMTAYFGGVRVLLGNGDGTFQSAVNYDTGSGSPTLAVAVGDFNGDRWPDLAVANLNGNNVSILLNDGVWTGPHPGPGGGAPGRGAGKGLGTPSLVPLSAIIDPAVTQVLTPLGSHDAPELVGKVPLSQGERASPVAPEPLRLIQGEPTPRTRVRSVSLSALAERQAREVLFAGQAKASLTLAWPEWIRIGAPDALALELAQSLA